MKNIITFAVCMAFFHGNLFSQTKILFDASKAETASNADWVIDANTHNLGFNNGPAVVGQGDESNAQQIPLPAQSGITGATAETFWQGALSYWGIDCVKNGYEVETLPYNGLITFGNGGNAQDLGNYKVFIVCEPNIIFTSAEKTAILNFVQNGGGLFMISDHDVSDRNNDGDDSPHIWNDLMNSNSIQVHPFGMSFDYLDFSQTSTNIPSLPNDSLLHGPMGNVTEVQWSSGTSLSLNPSQNPAVTGVIYKNGSAFGNSNVMCAHARFGLGKVAALGDSSPCDDGTGDNNDQLYNGYTQDANGNHRKLLMNTTIWLASQNQSTGIADESNASIDFALFPNPAHHDLHASYSLPENSSVGIKVFDITGKELKLISYVNHLPGEFTETITTDDFPAGIYYCTFSTNLYSKTVLVAIIK
ncbi:MAG: T9SS type A sorting domain-containing protein [Bacteroidetes bacterium]|nr:T9SS type A sorting domain-containing protein [Bacteroidota bacterium]